MLAKPKIYIHVGVPRTATTYLQEQIFRQTDQIHYLGRSKSEPFSKWQPYETIERCVFLHDDIKFNSTIEHLKSLVRSIHLSKQKPNVLSHEGFTRTTRFNLADGADTYRVIERLNILFETVADVHFILTVRDPVTCIKSTMVAFRSVFDHYNFSWKNLNEVVSGEKSEFNFILENFKYGSLYQTIERVRPQKTLVLFFEDLKYDKKKFIADLNGFINCNIAVPTSEPVNSVDSKLKKNYAKYRKKFTTKIWTKAFSISNYPRYCEKILDFIRVLHWHLRDWSDLGPQIRFFYEEDFNSLPQHIKTQFQKHGYFPTKGKQANISHEQSFNR